MKYQLQKRAMTKEKWMIAKQRQMPSENLSPFKSICPVIEEFFSLLVSENRHSHRQVYMLLFGCHILTQTCSLQ